MKRLVRAGVLLSVIALMMTGCNCFKKMSKNLEDVTANSQPEILAVTGQVVNSNISITFPAKYFNKKCILKVTPVLVYENGEIPGTPKFYQGESVKDNYTVVPFETGGTYTQEFSLPFEPKADLSTLELRVETLSKSVFVDLKKFVIAQGISTVQNNADWTAYMTIMPDNFKRVTTISESADLVYQINSSQVRSIALRADQIKLFENFVKENSTKDRTTLGSVYAKGYASPDGPEDLNDKLSRQRSETGKTAISKQLKNVSGLTYDAAAYGEDWEGFKKLVEQSNMKDKDLVLQVLNMYSSPTQRDREIHNMAQVFEVLKKDVLPQLRRTQLTASADISGKTDDELRAAARGDINSLNLEEMLFAATMFDDNADKARIYKAAADKFGDARALNNLGIALAKENKIADAKTALRNAELKSKAPEISNNLAAIAMIEGNLPEAAKYQASMNAGTKGLLALAGGDYANAIKGLDGYNLAIAQFCNGNMSAAKTALGSTDCPYADYLKAQIAMREGDTTGATAYLKSAIAKEPTLRGKAQRDVEFLKLHNTDAFKAL